MKINLTKNLTEKEKVPGMISIQVLTGSSLAFVNEPLEDFNPVPPNFG
jgi:hypothetical protein